MRDLAVMGSRLTNPWRTWWMLIFFVREFKSFSWFGSARHFRLVCLRSGSDILCISIRTHGLVDLTSGSLELAFRAAFFVRGTPRRKHMSTNRSYLCLHFLWEYLLHRGHHGYQPQNSYLAVPTYRNTLRNTLGLGPIYCLHPCPRWHCWHLVIPWQHLTRPYSRFWCV